MEAVTHLELVTLSFRIDAYDEERNDEARVTDLDLISKIQEKAQIRVMKIPTKVQEGI
jgi:hypothetical protein